MTPELTAETVPVASLTPHPDNYQAHPDAQLAHLEESVRQFGVYRNVVVSFDSVILAGHGVVETCRRLGVERIQVVRMPFDSRDPRARKLLVADNEISQGDGRLRMARDLERAWPGVARTVRHYRRPQHFVDWRKFDTPLRRRPSSDPDVERVEATRLEARDAAH